MRTFINKAGIVGLLLLTGCASDNEFNISGVNGNSSLTALIEGQDVQTRTAVDESGNVTWIESDELGVFGSQTQNARFKSTGSGASVAFVGNLSSVGESVSWAYYPYDKNAQTNGTSLVFTLPAEYTYTGNSNAPMLSSRAEGNKFVFKHLCGLLAITLSGGMPDGADRFVITSAGDAAPVIAGTATVADVNADGATLTVANNGGSNSVTYKLGDLAGNNDGFKTFFVPLPVGEYAKLEVSLYGKDKADPYFTRTISALNVRRSVMISMPILDGNTGKEYVLNEKTVDIAETLAGNVAVSSTDKTTLVYSKDVATENIPEVGDVLWSKVTDELPDGFLGKVASVKKNDDGTYEVATEAAALSEAFDKLYVNEEVKIDLPSNAPQTRGLLKPIIDSKDISIELPVKYENEEYHTYVDGEIGLGAVLTFNIKFDSMTKLQYAAFTLVLYSTIGADIGFKVSNLEDMKKIVDKKLAELVFPNIALLGGVIQFTPKIISYFDIKVGGEIENTVSLETELKATVSALYKDGEWQTLPLAKPDTKGNNESPWKFSSELSFKGEVSAGIGNEFSLALYGNDRARIYFAPEARLNVGGEVVVNDENLESLEAILSTAKLNTSFCVAGIIGADASLLVPGISEAEVPIYEKTIWEKELYLFPNFKKISANTTIQEQTGEGSANKYQADVNTNVSGELLTKDTQVSFVIEDEEGNEVEETERVDYGGGQVEEDTQTAIPLSMDGKFDNLKENATYKVYPVVYSSVIDSYTKNGKLKLKNQAVEIKTYNSFEDKLMQIYRDTDGDKWTHKEYWDVDGTVVLKRYSDGTGTSGYKGGCSNCVPGIVVHEFDLSGNNLNGNVTLKDCPELGTLDISDNIIPNLTIERCENLTVLQCNNSQLENLTIIDCPHLEILECNDNKLGGNIRIVNSFISGAINNNPSSPPRFECSNNSREVLDLSQCGQWGEYVQIVSTNCPNLHAVKIDLQTPFNLDCSLCPQIENLALDMPGLSRLLLSSCDNLTELTLDNCTRLYQLTCTGNSNLTTVSISDAALIEQFDCEGCDNLSALKCYRCFPVSSGANVIFKSKNLTELILVDCNLVRFYSYSDIAFKKTLQKLEIKSSNSSNFASVDLSDFSALISADLGKDVALESLENCTALCSLYCSGERLKDLEELKKCTSLTDLYFYGGSGEIPEWFKQYNFSTDSYKYSYIYSGNHSSSNPGEYQTDWIYTENTSGWYFPGEPQQGYCGW